MCLVTLIFDLLTMKLACETFLPNLGTLGIWVLELFAMYATDGQTDGETKTTLIAPSLRTGHNNALMTSRHSWANI